VGCISLEEADDRTRRCLTNPCFVEPFLTVHRSVDTDRTAVVLIAAPGAVGTRLLTVVFVLATRALDR